MLLRKVTVEHWRGLSGSIGPFSDALNLVSGPNESGKSRYFQAIKFALTQSYRGTNEARRALQSWGGDESPKVVIEFERNGNTYVLTKQYLRGQYARLEGAGQTLQDGDAEDWLHDLIGTSRGVGRRVADHLLGAWPLLLVEQGHSRTNSSDNLNATTRNNLTNRLSDELGVAAVSEASAALMTRVDDEWRRYFTVTGRDSTEVAKRRELVKELATRVQEAEAAYREQQLVSDALTIARTELANYEYRLAEAKTALESAEQAAEASLQMRQRLDDAAKKLESLVSDGVVAQQRIEKRSNLADAVEYLQRKLTEQHARFANVEGEFDRAQLALVHAKEQLRLSIEAHDKAEAKAAAARQVQSCNELVAERDETADLVRRVEERHNALSDLRRRLAAFPVVEHDDVDELRSMTQRLSRLEAQLDASAIELSITAHKPFTIGEQLLDPGTTHDIKIMGDEEVQLGDIATLAIKANSSSLEMLADKVEACRRELRAELGRLKVENVDTAAQVARHRQDLQGQIQLKQAELDTLSPKTLQEVKDQLAGLEARLAGLDIDADINVEGVLENERNAVVMLNSCRSIKDAAQDTLDDLRPQKEQLAAQLQEVRSELSALQQRLDELPSNEELVGSLSAADAALEVAKAEHAGIADEFERLGGDSAVEAPERLRRAMAQLESQEREQGLQVGRLKGKLEHVMGNGTYESFVECDAELALAKAELSRIENAASAAQRLKTVLERHRREVVDQLLEPVKNRVRPYLRLVFPQANLLADGNISFEGLVIGNQQESFEELSGGAQEQFSLMTRLGLAEVLAEDERLPLLLDDSLVNSDSSRIARVHAALDRASRNLQVIVFTCHEQFFDALGAQYQVRLPAQR